MSKFTIPKLDALDEFCKNDRRARQDDVSGTIYVARELEQLLPERYDRLFPDLDARLHIPLRGGINRNAGAWSYNSMDKRGEAKMIGANVTDLPRVGVSKKRHVNPIEVGGVAFGWSFREIAQARFAGEPLDTQLADAARMSAAELEHDILLNGHTGLSLPGFFTEKAVPSVTVTNGDWLGSATPDEILEDLNQVRQEIRNQSTKVHRANTILLPESHLDKLRTTARSTTSDRTILEFFQATNPGIQILAMARDEIATQGAGGTPRMLAYQKDPSVLTGVVPDPFFVHAPQTRNLEVVVNTELVIGGTVWYYPLAGCYGDGI